VFAKFRMVNTDVSLSLLRVYFIFVVGCLIYLSVNRSHGVGKAGAGAGTGAE